MSDSNETIRLLPKNEKLQAFDFRLI